MHRCKIDSTEWISLKALSCHLKKKHKLELLNYFVRFENFSIPKCKVCKTKDAKYTGKGLKFFEFCSSTCRAIHNNKQRKEHRSNTEQQTFLKLKDVLKQRTNLKNFSLENNVNFPRFRKYLNQVQKKQKCKTKKHYNFVSQTSLKGSIGELAVMIDFLKFGYVPCKPYIEGAPFDFVCIKEDRVIKIQVKYDDSQDKNHVVISGCHKSRHYSENEVDILATYSPKTNKCYYATLKFLHNRKTSGLALRLTQQKTKQQKNILFAKDFENIPLA